MRLTLALVLTLFVGCAGPEPAEPDPVLSAEGIPEGTEVASNKELHKDLIARLSTELTTEFPNTGYLAVFNGMDAIMVREFLGETGGVVWANGVTLTAVFPSFMRSQHPPDGVPTVGLAVQDNVVVGTVCKLKDH